MNSKFKFVRFAFAMALVLAVFTFVGGKQPAQARATFPIQVPAATEWVSTGIWVYTTDVGLKVNIHTTGTVITAPVNWYGSGARSGPAGQTTNCANVTGVEPEYICALDGYPYGMLVGRIGNTVFPIGDAPNFSLPARGFLYLAVNDYLGTYWDNNGEFSVLIEFK